MDNPYDNPRFIELLVRYRRGGLAAGSAEFMELVKLSDEWFEAAAAACRTEKAAEHVRGYNREWKRRNGLEA